MSAFDRAFAGLADEIDTLLERRHALVVAEPTLRDLEAAFPCGYLTVYGTFEYTVYLLNQPGFTAESNPELLSALEKADKILGGAEVTTEDRPRDNTRIYRLTAGRVCARFVVTLVEDDGAACHRQVIGFEEATEERLVRVQVARPVYQFTC